MTQISMDKDLAMDLIESKLRNIKKQILEILGKWNQPSAEIMIQLSRDGKLPESEIDAIGLTNLQKKMYELEKYQRSLED
ncbi:hypothetical protein DSAG12_02250 [Promethearchaeum syntrophicum]|uniref:Uncharacterized protein n=1 Tax=Promethearchaeum syntrophicum TaxID=2594042 RepID=A0A5B9DCD8_9ARCH|nr:hypothetical protein [Candidatus Prometheoarchaeum syntrophicum]QEE16420.1 hypothetical protein DSAG12_02250 [Candidatus Prometheoarchaeum syntrophicum]